MWSEGHDEPLSLEEGQWVGEEPAGRGASSVALPLMPLSALVAVSKQMPFPQLHRRKPSAKRCQKLSLIYLRGGF